jgi:hypothetical protein
MRRLYQDQIIQNKPKRITKLPKTMLTIPYRRGSNPKRRSSQRPIPLPRAGKRMPKRKMERR